MKTLFKVVYDDEIWEVKQTKRDSTGETFYKIARAQGLSFVIRTVRACDCVHLNTEDGGSDAA